LMVRGAERGGNGVGGHSNPACTGPVGPDAG